MPTYEYECEECGYKFEIFQNMKDEPLRTCPKCGEKITRLIGAGGGIIFKGSGFYSTDYKTNSPSCGRDIPCCGREKRCDKPPCK